ncbi:MAG: TetR/AcrR family transcriptional regulator [Bosea sp. (in: a-proteobacteria)]
MNIIHYSFTSPLDQWVICAMSCVMEVQARPKTRTIDPEGKRAAILRAAQDLFAAQGFEKTVIAEIATKADVAVGSVHRIFGDKNRLLLEAQSDIEQHFILAMIEGWNVPGTIRGRFRSMLRALFDDMIRLRAHMPMMALRADGQWDASASEGTTLRNAIAGLMREAITKGEFREVPVEIMASITFGMVDAAMTSAFASADNGAIDTYIEALSDAMERVLGK